jgi:hypothetical protein
VNSTKWNDINMPNPSRGDDISLTRFEHGGKQYILFVAVNQDPGPMYPADRNDEEAFLVYGHRSFTVNGPNHEKAEDIHKAKAEWEKTHHVYPVYAYIHSGVYLKLNTDAGLPDRQWDVSMAGYCLVTRDTSNIPEPLKLAEGMIEEWNQYLRGDVSGYDMGLYEFQSDPDGDPIEEFDYYKRHGKEVYKDSCWRFYGTEYVLIAAKSMAESYINGLNKKAIQIH